MQPTLSAAIITLDAGRTLEPTLESLAWVDEVVVLDSGSTDETEDITRRHGARFLSANWAGYGAQKQRAAEATSGDWILSVDADEVVTGTLADQIRRAVADPGDRVAYRVVRHNRFLGAWLGSRGWWAERPLRLFRRGRAEFDRAPVHEQLRAEGPVGLLAGPLLHRPWQSVEHRLKKHNRYSTLEAGIDHERGRGRGALAPLLRAARWFVKTYVGRGGFLYGRAGLLHAGMTAAYQFQRAAKAAELWRGDGPEPGGPVAAPPGKENR